MIVRYTGLFLFLGFLLSDSSEARQYTIKQGDHYSSPTAIRTFSGTRMDLTFAFDASAEYEFTGDAVSDQADSNKLYGFSDCGSLDSRKFSARFGWRWYNNSLQILAYTHVDSKFLPPEVITTVVPGRGYTGSIEISPDHASYIYTVGNAVVTTRRGCTDAKAKGFYEYPYFGGNQVAPHDIKIKVDTSESFALVNLPYPNPVTTGKFSVKVDTFESLNFYFKMYDMLGRLVWSSDSRRLPFAEDQILTYDLTRRFAAGMYLLYPVTVLDDGTEVKATTSAASQGVLKILIINQK